MHASIDIEEPAFATFAPTPLVTIQPHGHRAPFYCVHPTTSTMEWFYRLSAYLGPDQPFHAFDARRLALPADGLTIRELAVRYVDALWASGGQPPYRLGGMCVGGVIALEMAHLLASTGATVEVVILLDAARLPRPPEPLAALVRRACRELLTGWRPLPGALVRRPRALATNLRANLHMTDHDGVRPWEWAHDRAVPELVLRASSRRARRNLELQRALVRAVRRHPMRPYPGRTVVIRPHAPPGGFVGPFFDWPQLVSGPLVEVFLGERHGVLMREPLVRDVAPIVAATLAGVTPQPVARS